MPLRRSSHNPAPATETIYAPQFLATTMGMFVLVFLVAFESMAVTTVMPMVSELLNGERYFALAFAAPIASGMLGMVAAGEVTDRWGPKHPLFISVAIFCVGLLICGSAANMPMLIGGRILQGVGGGAITVAIYVLIARAYPGQLHSKIFALFATAWVQPAMVGPWLAGLMAVHLGWRWVFSGVAVLVIVAFCAMVPVLKSLDSERNQELGPVSVKRLGLAGLTGLAVISMNLLGNSNSRWSLAGLALALVVALVAIRPLLPRGTFLARRGLPATITTRIFITGAFFGVEVYLPYLLREDYQLAPDRAGLILTASALCWSMGSWLQGRLGEKVASSTCITVGSVAGSVAIATALATALFHPPVLVLVCGWAVGGFGMGMIFPRQNVNMLALSTKEEQGFNSSAMSVADSLGNAGATAIGGVIFALAAAGTGFVAVFSFSLVLVLVLIAMSPRTKGAPALAAR
ncbi:MFS transporter [Glutamicibacter halophytocola]|uniref:MFS transporter n=1 Tax=Glutamicibacter halophytocola TaxID=1933880 RepID=A0ABX5YB26_9MICC|nr:MFS transporter [Glutamicibacter halophytocola]QDY66884.1 MFS transporter [Glutamicibacter halophytocola]